MTLPKILLVPMDFGPGSEAALTYAIELARPLGAELVVLHVWDLPPIGFPEGALVVAANLGEQLEAAAREGVDRIVREHQIADVALRGITKQGEPWRCVAEAVQELGAGLIVMGTHGRRGLPRAILGSVAEKVVRTAPCPVLIVHGGDVQGSDRGHA